VILAGTAWLVIAVGSVGFIVTAGLFPWFWPIDVLLFIFGIVVPSLILGSMWNYASPRGGWLGACYAGVLAVVVWRSFGMTWALPLVLTAVLGLVAAIQLRR
jgi:hypothetical protein